MPPVKDQNKYKIIFDNSPVAIIEVDYSPLLPLSQQLEEQMVTNIRQFLSENSDLVKKTYRKIRIAEANTAAFILFGVKGQKDLLARLTHQGFYGHSH